MRKDKLSKQNVILYFLGIIPVVWLGLLSRGFLKDKTKPEVRENEINESTIEDMEGSHAVVCPIHGCGHHDSHEKQDGSVVDDKKPGEELHESVLLEHGVSSGLEVLVLLQDLV